MTVGSGKFISKKVSKVRWMPQYDTSQLESNSLVTGSWDDEVNNVILWSRSGEETCQQATCNVNGDVTGLEWVTHDTVCISTSAGWVGLIRTGAVQKLQRVQEWNNVHVSGSGGCTTMATHGDSIVTGGQEGKINVLTPSSRSPIKVYEKADSCTITAVSFIRTNEMMSANMRGQLKLWDLRSNSLVPESSCSQDGGVTCLACHPTQSHVLMSGGQDGVLAVWDLRNPQHPATLLSADKASISEVKFHPSQPDHVFTCSQGGDVCHWNSVGVRREQMSLGRDQLGQYNNVSPWLSYEAVKHRVETHSLVTRQPLPVNSLDVIGGNVVFGGDTEAFYILNNVIA